MNPYFKEPPDSVLLNDDAFGSARAEFFENRDRFVDRLACAQYFDLERFEAMILWLKTLKRFHDANALPMLSIYFQEAGSISALLETQSRYSKTQRDACSVALVEWRGVLNAVGANR